MTSEQKLLQLIRRFPKDQKAAVPRSVFASEFGRRYWSAEHLWLWINRLLILVVALMAAGLVWRYRFLQKPYVLQDVDARVPSSPGAEKMPSVVQRVSFDELKDVFLSRNVFRPPVPDVPEELPAPQAAVPQINLNQQYRIVGIALGAQPTAIVENIQNASTIFLSVGDQLDQAVVKEIQQDRVILDMNGQIVELKS